MATYAIGDVQGCFDELLTLLDIIHYRPNYDFLWFTGDLVNRGPKSLEVLRFVKNTPRVLTVLGNHDLTLLAIAYVHHPNQNHTLHEVLTAPDKEEILTWLRGQPLLFDCTDSNYVMAHAGIPPAWSLNEAVHNAKEISNLLTGPRFKDLLSQMFGNHPTRWDRNLMGWERYRYIINGFTRMRLCNEEDGTLDFSHKGSPKTAPPGLVPWYEIQRKEALNKKIIFGHWAAIEGKIGRSDVICLDTGCVWGRGLTALRLDDEKVFTVSCTKDK